MKTTKLKPCTREVILHSYLSEPLRMGSVTGHEFEFIDYPGILFFIYKDERLKNWQLREATSGANAGLEYGENTRSGIIATQFERLEAMRNAKNQAGSHAAVKALFDRCIASFKRPEPVAI